MPDPDDTKKRVKCPADQSIDEWLADYNGSCKTKENGQFSQPEKQKVKKNTLIEIEPKRPQAPTGKYLGCVMHVEPNWTFLGNRKVALYFEILEGPNKECEARKFYGLKLQENGEYKAGAKSNLVKDMYRFFPNESNNEGLDPMLFKGKIFLIEVVLIKSDSGESNAIVTSMSLHRVLE